MNQSPSHSSAACRYIELSVTSNFSFLCGASHPEELIQQAALLGYPALAITDTNSLAGIVRAHTAAKESGISLITGCRLTLLAALDPLTTSPTTTTPSHPLSLLLYPTTRAAYGRLCQLLTLGKSRAPKGECYLTIDDLPQFASELLAIAVIHRFKDKQLRPALTRLHTIFPPDISSFDTLSLALTKHYSAADSREERQLVTLSSELNLPLVVTNDVHYHSAKRRKLQDVLTCIRHGCTLNDAGYRLHANAERHLKPQAEITRLFSHHPAALKRSLEIAERAMGFSLDQLRYEYPHEICPTHRSPQEQLTALTWQGATERYPEGIPAKVKAQILHELALIAELNYAKYFLTVHDIVAFARSQDILCQGRGAAANSAVCYCLGVTSVDPDRINLLFERFISRERNEPPDIDVDFEHERREEVIQYIYNKYGRHRAALVAEVISYRTRSAIRDVSKVFGVPPDTISALTKLTTRAPDKTPAAADLAKINLPLSDPRTGEILTLSKTLYGFPRHLSQHVGGFIISETPLSEIAPIENAAMAERTVIEWNKDDIEQLGMLKIDILALGMLTCIRKALGLVNQNHISSNTSGTVAKQRPTANLMLHNVPAEDPAVYQMISQADTLGVFQIESRAQMSMLPRLRPRCFYDLVIEVAIVRPGPIAGGMVHPYLRRRDGREPVTYADTKMKQILESTLGVPIFQEQVMQLVVAAAGFTPGEADNLRRSMASWKRKTKVMDLFGNKIRRGMAQNGYPPEFAEQIIQQIAGFGEYGFPQSHAASFAFLVYISAWLKTHHPAAFAAALLNSQPMGFYQPSQIIQDAERHGVKVLPIDALRSSWDCTLEHTHSTAEDAVGADDYRSLQPRLRLGLRLVAGLARKEAERLVGVGGEMRSRVISTSSNPRNATQTLLTLWRTSEVRVSTLKILAGADAFRSIGLNRQQALWQINKLRDDPLPLFSQVAGYSEQREPPTVLPPFSKSAEVFADYVTTGLSLKAHPLSFVRSQLAQRRIITAQMLRSPIFPHGAQLSVAGLVLVRQRPPTANGTLFMTIEDETGTANLIVRPAVFNSYRNTLYDATALLAHGRLQRQDGVVNLLVTRADDLSCSLTPLPNSSRDFR